MSAPEASPPQTTPPQTPPSTATTPPAVTASAGAPSPRQLALAALAAELTPAKSLQRLDTATARVLSTVTVVASLLTGFGLLAAGLSFLTAPGRVLAGIAVGLAFLAVVAALAAQTVTISRGLNTNNLRAVDYWYRRRFQRRAPLTRAASVSLVLAAAAAGAAALVTLTGGRASTPTLAVTRTTTPASPATSGSPAMPSTSTVTGDVTFRGLDPGQVATATLTVDGTLLVATAFGPGPDGTATRTLTANRLPAAAVTVIDARAGGITCTATLAPGRPAEQDCTRS
jgi:hypothetical protein